MNIYHIFLIFLVIITIVIYFNLDTIKVWLFTRLIILRGILAPNCFWYKVSDIILTGIFNDGTGVKIYNDFKEDHKDFKKLNMFNKNIYLVTNVNYIKTILDNSPNLFGVGELKYRFFKSFMEKNVGVSQGVCEGCPWKSRRRINEYALNTDKVHSDSVYYNNYVRDYLNKWIDLDTINYDNFMNLAKYIAAKIIFNVNTEDLNSDVFNIFKKANSLESYSESFKINDKVHNNYTRELNKYIDNPKDKSLIKLLTETSNDKEEILHQIPHFIFPIVGLYLTSIPRLLVLLINHKDVFQNVINEVHSIHNDYNISKMDYTRKCLLETVRLNNPVISTFRTLLQDYSFDDKHHFKKGTQFLILNNPVLREKEYYKQPNQFIPERWTNEMEKSYYAISFNQGPQRCPGKDLVIYLTQSFIYNFIKINNITINNIKTEKIDKNYIPQIINPCDIEFTKESGEK